MLTESSCNDDVSWYISRHIDVSYEVLANNDEHLETSSAGRLRGRFNLTNTRTLRHGHWQLFMSSFRGMQFNDNGTMLGDSGLKARFLLEFFFTAHTGSFCLRYFVVGLSDYVNIGLEQ